MRNASILVINLKGVAAEAIKNIVLAGIGRLVIVDPAAVAEEDLGACFFFRDEDVGKKVSVRLRAMVADILWGIFGSHGLCREWKPRKAEWKVSILWSL